MKRFSDFAKTSTQITGDKIKIEQIVGKEIEILDYSINDSKYKEGTKVLKLQFKLDGDTRIVFTGSNVLIDQISQYKDEIPFITKIEKVNKFYTFT